MTEDEYQQKLDEHAEYWQNKFEEQEQEHRKRIRVANDYVAKMETQLTQEKVFFRNILNDLTGQILDRIG